MASWDHEDLKGNLKTKRQPKEAPPIDWKQRAESAEREREEWALAARAAGHVSDALTKERDEARAKVERYEKALLDIADDKVICMHGMVCVGHLCYRDRARAALKEKP